MTTHLCLESHFLLEIDQSKELWLKSLYGINGLNNVERYVKHQIIIII